MKKFVKFSEVRKNRNYLSELAKKSMGNVKAGAEDADTAECPYINVKYGICEYLDPATRYGVCPYHYICLV